MLGVYEEHAPPLDTDSAVFDSSERLGYATWSPKLFMLVAQLLSMALKHCLYVLHFTFAQKCVNVHAAQASRAASFENHE